MPTQLAQIGSVAKTQARNQQAAQPATNFHEQQDKDDSLKAQRVKETEKAQQQKVDPDEDRRRERRKRRQQKQALQALEESGPDALHNDEENPEEEELGRLIDMRA